MPTRKIADLPREATCRSDDHNPPTHIYWPDGVYEHVCSGCGRMFKFTIDSPRYESAGTPYQATWTTPTRQTAGGEG